MPAVLHPTLHGFWGSKFGSSRVQGKTLPTKHLPSPQYSFTYPISVKMHSLVMTQEKCPFLLILGKEDRRQLN